MKDIIGELNKYPEGYWDFKGKIKTGIHNIGKYPATMVPDMQCELLNIIVKQIKDNNKDSNIYKIFLNNMTENYLNNTTDVRKVIDYIAGMTDEFITREYEEIKSNS